MLVKQIGNLFELMELFAQAKKPLSVADIVEAFSWPRSSAFNIVSTMVEYGYLYQPQPRGGYYPTSKWMELALDVSRFQHLPESVHELLIELMKETGETMMLAAPEGTSITLLDVIETPADIRYIVNVGQRLPIHVTAAGRAILAQYSDAERAATLNRIKYRAYEKATFMTPESVEMDIRKSAQNGWYINPGIYQSGVAGIAVPFPYREQRYAIVLGGPISRIEGRTDSLGKLLRESVERFLRNLKN